MATMNTLPSDSRGQLFVVAGVVIAAILVTIAIVFNTALYTEAQAVGDSYDGNAVASAELKESKRIDISNMLRVENEQMDGTAPSDMETIVSNIDTYLQNRQVKRGVVATISHDSTVEGTRVEWTDNTQPFTNADGNATWDVATFTDIRAYEVTPDTASLSELSDPSVSTLESSVFGVRFNPDDTNNKTRYMYVNSNNNELTVRSVDATDTITGTCSMTNTTTNAVQFTTNSLTTDGSQSRCAELWPDITVDKIQYVNGDDAKGRFNFTVTGGSITTPSEMRTADAVYAMDVTYNYQTTSVTHTTTTRIAPQEP